MRFDEYSKIDVSSCSFVHLGALYFFVIEFIKKKRRVSLTSNSRFELIFMCIFLFFFFLFRFPLFTYKTSLIEFKIWFVTVKQMTGTVEQVGWRIFKENTLHKKGKEMQRKYRRKSVNLLTLVLLDVCYAGKNWNILVLILLLIPTFIG